eukprot:15448373-Alexandrium_andersonii.AAC.1
MGYQPRRPTYAVVSKGDRKNQIADSLLRGLGRIRWPSVRRAVFPNDMRSGPGLAGTSRLHNPEPLRNPMPKMCDP